MEVAKIARRALLWAKLLTQFNPKDPVAVAAHALPTRAGRDRTGRLHQCDAAPPSRRCAGPRQATRSPRTQTPSRCACAAADRFLFSFLLSSARIAPTPIVWQQESGNHLYLILGGSFLCRTADPDLAAKPGAYNPESKRASPGEAI